ncbi:hypothetical protein [Paracoccus benzoatiresistens]|uniref:FixH family protein n=1 Tax=Paracoccus benzoatiresistens TaxID=2997341 RepID=A0ABT4J1L3_9RHOB|nr:hypothetical protein [Paracoccus sp. EF6]MCZ0960985.1 hypothetical protein [Paracoccus sp. EF6]
MTIPEIRPDGLQLDEPRDRQRRYWRIQRIAWWTFGAVMLLAILGLTGSGGVFHTQTIHFANARAEVPRVSRWEGMDEVAIIFDNPADSHEVRISQPFFERFSVERIQPEPDQSLLAQGAQTMTFPTAGPAPHEVKLDLRATHFGWTGFDMTVEGETRRINLLVLP